MSKEDIDQFLNKKFRFASKEDTNKFLLKNNSDLNLKKMQINFYF